MVEKAEKPTDNTFTFLCNEKGWSIVQRVLGEYLSNRKVDGAYLWSNQGEGKYVKVGNTFDAYEWCEHYCPTNSYLSAEIPTWQSAVNNSSTSNIIFRIIEMITI